MPQIKIYGLAKSLASYKVKLSDTIHRCFQEALGVPQQNRCHRFITLEPDDFFYPSDRTARHLIIEVSLFEGRSVETKKHLLKLLMQRIHQEIKIPLNDIEITIFETPRANWGIRGQTGDELNLSYRVDP